jgi:hypothetical protein
VIDPPLRLIVLAVVHEGFVGGEVDAEGTDVAGRSRRSRR